MAIDPRISLGVQPIQIDNPLAQYGQVQNILAAQQQMRGAETQQQVSQLQLQNLQRSADYVNKMQESIAKNGGPLDIEEAAKMMATHPDPSVAQHGYTLLQAVQDKKLFEDYIRKQSPNAAAPAATPLPADGSVIQQRGGQNVLGPDDESYKAWVADKTTNLDFKPWLEQKNAAQTTNALAPAPAAPVNNLASAPAADLAPGPAQIAKLKQEITELALLKDPRAAKLLASKEAELKILQTPHVVPNVGLADASGNVYVKAPATPTNLARLQAEMADLPPNDPRRAQYASMIQKETQNAPTQLAQLIKERDALPANDPNRQFYDTAITKAQVELNIQKAHLKLAQDRFNEEFSMGKLTPNTIDMMANVYLQTGNLPPISAGKRGSEAKAQILNRAQEISGGNGMTPAQTATNVVQGKQDVAGQTATIRDFSSGMSARKVTANNTALNHLATMDKLADELNNSDIRVFNLAANAFAKATGSAPPSNFDAAKQFVAGEVMKAIAQNGGGVTERQEAERNITSQSSPEQLRGVIKTYKELLGGQLSSLQTQYETGSGRKDFDKKLTPAAREVLNKSAPAAAPAPATTKSGATVSNW